MRELLRHLFLPRTSNNHRAKLLHHKSLLAVTLLLVVSSFLLVGIRVKYPSVLGISTDISAEQLLLLTNQKRQENGLASLNLNPQLSQAASGKAQDMLALNYWAHNAPDGKTPWVFIKGAGYNYIYAGENLARGFTNAGDAINAWMASPEHRKNMLSSNYKDVGYAVATGTLNGEETVLIVEMFGSTNLEAVAKTNIQPQANVAAVTSTENTKEQIQPSFTPTPTVNLVASEEIKTKTVLEAIKSKPQPIVNSVTFSSIVTKFIIGLFIFILILDMIVVERKRLIRLVGHNLDHVFFLIVIFAIVTLIAKGVIV